MFFSPPQNCPVTSKLPVCRLKAEIFAAADPRAATAQLPHSDEVKSFGSLLSSASCAGKLSQKWLPCCPVRSLSCSPSTVIVRQFFIPVLFPSPEPVTLSRGRFTFGSPQCASQQTLFKFWYFLPGAPLLRCELRACCCSTEIFHFDLVNVLLSLLPSFCQCLRV